MRVLEVTGLKKSFGGVVAVDSLDFSVDEDETLGIIGPNGAGKTTIFNLITRFYTPDRGMIRYFGADVTRAAPSTLAHLGIARTFQNLRLFKSLTVAMNIVAPLLSLKGYNLFHAIFKTDMYRTREEAAQHRAAELLDFFTSPARQTFLPIISPMVISAAWRLPGPSPWIPDSFSLTSPVRG